MTIYSKYNSAPLAIAALLVSTAACSEPTTANIEQSSSASMSQANDTKKPEFTTQAVATFNEPWAMTALPKTGNDALKLLVTQKSGELLVVDTQTGAKTQVAGVPEVAYGGQGGLGDVTLAPDFRMTNAIYISHAEAGSGADSNKYGARVIKATLSGLDTDKPSLQNISTIWQQNKKIDGQGHYSHRLLFSPDGRYLYISSGDRQEKQPAQDMSLNLGKIIRLHPDGTIPSDNPYANNNDISAQFWSTGHRNVLGMAFDESGRLWSNEMGPRGGDEYNLIVKGNNYGWPVVSNGRNYSGTDIPDHDTRPEFEPPKVSWTPVISPSSLSIYTSGSQNDFPAWQGKALMSGLSSKALIVVDMDAAGSASERYRYDMGARIRNVTTVEGQVWLLEDGDDGRLLQLLPQ
ncbi:PQQ-dependent sugar dehydrogenase [Psychrobacter sp. DM8]|uniref:PQQ-dependent sugar dehydrogenase n=1 Tax=Psychrobacter sp. DM8 TaxID=3440636 RepID=UPI003F4FED54